MNHTPLTVIIPCKNELPNIKECVDSVREIADEIIVADSGSTDGTIELVQSWADCGLIQCDEYVNYANFNNWCIPHASHDWVLVVDADERVSPELALEVKAMKAEMLANTDNDAFWMPRKNYFMGQLIRYSGWQRDGAVRLFRSQCRYQPKNVHPQLDVPSEKLGHLKMHLFHHTYRSFSHYMEKVERYTTWGANDAYQKGRRFHLTDLVFRPVFRLFRHYILKRGFLDGKAGFAISCLSAMSVLLKCLKLWEIETNKKHAMQPADRNESSFKRAA